MRRWLLLVLGMHTVIRLSPAVAYSTGISGYSGKQGPTCKTQLGCHTSTVPKAPTVQFTGPTEVPAQAMATFQFTVHSRAPATQKFAGFDVASSGGVLVPGICNGLPGDCQHHVAPFMDEITHSAPQANVAGDCIFEFTWQAPATPGNYILYGAGNSVNRNLLNTGDKPAVTTFMINVVAGAPSATPTVTNTPTQPTATTTPTTTLTPIPSNISTAQPTDTASASPTEASTPSPTDTPAPSPTDSPSPSLTETPTTTSTPVPCTGDCNQDRRVTTDELLAGLRIALGGIDLPACESLAKNSDGPVTVDVLLIACNRAVTDCAAP